MTYSTIYVNIFTITAYPGGIFRIAFSDRVQQEPPTERSILAMTRADAKQLAEKILEVLEKS